MSNAFDLKRQLKRKWLSGEWRGKVRNGSAPGNRDFASSSIASWRYPMARNLVLRGLQRPQKKSTMSISTTNLFQDLINHMCIPLWVDSKILQIGAILCCIGV